MMHTRKMLVVPLLFFLFEGCGQSGPLYLPGDSSEIQNPPTEGTIPREEDEDEADDQDNGN